MKTTVKSREGGIGRVGCYSCRRVFSFVSSLSCFQHFFSFMFVRVFFVHSPSFWISSCKAVMLIVCDYPLASEVSVRRKVEARTALERLQTPGRTVGIE
jgi:hypothetical protein